MKRYSYHIVNVFTQGSNPFSGNPLCVFEDAQGLTDEQMQSLTRQFNLSETTFILPPASNANKRVRIFTPAYEMPFAGHPTLGTASIVSQLLLQPADQSANLTLEMGAGLIPVTRTGNSTLWTLTARPATHRAVNQSNANLAAALGLQANDILNNGAQKPLWVKAGKEQLIVPLASEAAVRNVKADARLFESIKSEDNNSMALVFAEVAPGKVLARFFFSNGNVMLEDPATGSACANLGGWYQAAEIAKPGAALARSVSQGEYLQRPSTLFLDVTASGEIKVGGEIIPLGRGVVEL